MVGGCDSLVQFFSLLSKQNTVKLPTCLTGEAGLRDPGVGRLVGRVAGNLGPGASPVYQESQRLVTVPPALKMVLWQKARNKATPLAPHPTQAHLPSLALLIGEGESPWVLGVRAAPLA